MVMDLPGQGTNGGESYIGPSGAKIKPASGGGAGGVTDTAPHTGNGWIWWWTSNTLLDLAVLV